MAHEAQSWKVADMNVVGDTFVITGASSGLGYHAAYNLARRGATVAMVGRSEEKLVRARSLIAAGSDDMADRLHTYVADMASLQTVRNVGHAIAEKHTAIRGLILNAGTLMPPERETVDGYEIHMGVNLLAPAVMLDAVGHAITNDASSAIVFVGSSGEKQARGEVDLTKQRRGWLRANSYSLSKAALHAYGEALDKQLSSEQIAIRSITAEPGMTHTELFNNPGSLPRILGSFAAGKRKPFIAVRSILRAATDTTLEGGAYVGPDRNDMPVVKRPASRVQEVAFQEQVWRMVTDATGLGHDWIASREAA